MGSVTVDLDALRIALAEKQASVERQGDLIRALKSSNVDKSEIEQAVNVLKHLKVELELINKEYAVMVAGTNEIGSRESHRQAVNNVLERRLFLIPSFRIYGGVAGLYDYGPPGCAVKANVLAFWRKHFVLEENMLEVDCPCVTPEAVLKASGHVDKFTDLMVKDEKTGMCYRADHLLKDYCKEALEKDPLMPNEKRDELKHVLAVLDELNADQLGEKLRHFGITAPDTKNPLSNPYPFNLMFSSSIGPTGLQPGLKEKNRKKKVTYLTRSMLEDLISVGVKA